MSRKSLRLARLTVLPSRKSRCCETAGNVVNVGFDHHCDLSLVKVFINSRHVPYVLTTWHQKIFWILDLLTQGLLIKPVYDANKYSVTNTRNISPILLIPWAKLWSGLNSSHPLSRLRNGAYPGPAVLFSSRIPLLKFLSSRILPPFSLWSRIPPNLCWILFNYNISSLVQTDVKLP